MNLTYSAMKALKSFNERYEYLRLKGSVGIETFGSARYLNQTFYHLSKEWRSIRDEVILRDNGCDLGCEDRPIQGKIIVHHINPISEEDIVECSPLLLDPENLVCVSLLTHNAIHYGNSSLLYQEPLIRTPNDTCPWKGGRL